MHDSFRRKMTVTTTKKTQVNTSGVIFSFKISNLLIFVNAKSIPAILHDHPSRKCTMLGEIIVYFVYSYIFVVMSR